MIIFLSGLLGDYRLYLLGNNLLFSPYNMKIGNMMPLDSLFFVDYGGNHSSRFDI